MSLFLIFFLVFHWGNVVKKFRWKGGVWKKDKKGDIHIGGLSIEGGLKASAHYKVTTLTFFT